MSGSDSNKFLNVDPKMYILNEHNVYITEAYIEGMLSNRKINYKVKDIKLFRNAMTHISYLDRDISFYSRNKTSKYKFGKELDMIHDVTKAIPLQEDSYERLEFVGDSVIHLVLAEYLWKRYEPQDEGFMTRLRTKIENGQTLAELNKAIGLNKYVLLSRLMEKNGCREKNYHILEDSFEAFIAALFIDSENNYGLCKELIVKLIETEIDLAELLHIETNFKDILLQFFHKENWEDPTYHQLDVSGPDHKKQFTIVVKRRKTPQDEGQIVGSGIATSKKKAEQDAAQEALKHYGILNDPDNDKSESLSDFSEEISDDDFDDASFVDDEPANDKNYKLEKKVIIKADI